jgi:hypothetical protein
VLDYDTVVLELDGGKLALFVCQRVTHHFAPFFFGVPTLYPVLAQPPPINAKELLLMISFGVLLGQ